MKDRLSQNQLIKPAKFTNTNVGKASVNAGIKNVETERLNNGQEGVKSFMKGDRVKAERNITKLRSLETDRPYRRETNDSNNPFFQAAEMNPLMVVSTDRLGIIEYVNPSFLSTTGSNSDEVLGQQINMLTCGVEILPYSCELKRAIKAGKSWKGELKSLRNSGESFAVSVHVSPVTDDLGFVTNFVVVAQDISSFKATKEQLKNATEENKVLLSELHHRVKNNLAIITGLMQLQAFNEEDEIIQNRLFSSVSRVQTMAAMHELLYETESFVRLNFGENLKNIVSSVSKMYHAVSANVYIKMDIEAVELNINQAHPCSLIVNEVVSNVFKHAFDTSTINSMLALRLCTKNEVVFLEVEDNGKGLPAGFEKYNQDATLGFKLLITLVRQLNGEYQYRQNEKGGTTFTLSFQKEEVKGPNTAHLC